MTPTKPTTPPTLTFTTPPAPQPALSPPTLFTEISTMHHFAESSVSPHRPWVALGNAMALVLALTCAAPALAQTAAEPAAAPTAIAPIRKLDSAVAQASAATTSEGTASPYGLRVTWVQGDWVARYTDHPGLYVDGQLVRDHRQGAGATPPDANGAAGAQRFLG